MGKKLHVCLLTFARIFEVRYGGEGKLTVSLAEWLHKQGQDVTVMGSTFSNVKYKRLANQESQEVNQIVSPKKKIKIVYPPFIIYFFSRFVLSLLCIIKIYQLNKKYPITVIHAQDTGYSGLAAIVSGRLLKIPIIISSNGIRHKSLESNIHGRFKGILIRVERAVDLFTINNADGFVVINPAVKSYYEMLVSKRVDLIMPIPIKVSDFEFSETNRAKVREEMGIDRTTKVIGFVGRFSAEKNLYTLLSAFANIAEVNTAKLVLVGTGYLESRLREYVNKRGIGDKVIFSGVRYDISRILACFDIFVLPSYSEGFGAALLEAMAAGRAGICSDINTFREWVTHNQEVLLVNPNSVEELEHAIELLCKDDSLRLKLGYNARMKASQYDEDIVYPKILEYYQKLLGEDKINTH